MSAYNAQQTTIDNNRRFFPTN